MAEGNTTWPTDSGGNSGVGPQANDSNFYHFRSDNTTAKNLAVAVRDATGVSFGTTANPFEVRAGGAVAVAEVTLAISTSPAYTAADNIGGKLSFTSVVRVSGGSGIIQTVRLVDQDNEKTAKDVVFFAADPSTSTLTDNTAMDVADAEMASIIGFVSIAAADYISFADNAVAFKSALGIPFKLATGTTLFAAVIERGTPTYTATTDLILEISVLQD